MMHFMKRDWIKNRLSDLKKTQVGLAKALGLEHPRISEMIKGKRELKLAELPKFAQYMEMGIIDVMSKFGLEVLESVRHNYVTIEGYVQAGRFGEANEDTVSGKKIIYGDPKYPDAHCLIVRGDSMNLRYKDGTKLICVPFCGEAEEIPPGKAVIVEAITEDDKREYTVKEFYTDEGGVHWLLPRSSNPLYQNYPVPNGKDIDVIINGNRIKNILIKAIVVSSQYDED